MGVNYLEILDGPKGGVRFRLQEGMRIGRTTGEILLEDAKVSSMHAKVEKGARGGLVLVDQGSSNGLRINGQKVKRVAMLPGVIFLVGKTTFKVIEVYSENPVEEASPMPAEPERRHWKDVLLTEVPKLATRNLDSIMLVAAFRPALQLDFLEGVQLENQILLGYGPRRFGSDVLDIELQEPLCPPLAFEILSEDGEAVFRTQYPKLVLLNDEPVTTAALKEGDRIRIGQTLILISFAA